MVRSLDACDVGSLPPVGKYARTRTGQRPTPGTPGEVNTQSASGRGKRQIWSSVRRQSGSPHTRRKRIRPVAGRVSSAGERAVLARNRLSSGKSRTVGRPSARLRQPGRGRHQTRGGLCRRQRPAQSTAGAQLLLQAGGLATGQNPRAPACARMAQPPRYTPSPPRSRYAPRPRRTVAQLLQQLLRLILGRHGPRAVRR